MSANTTIQEGGNGYPFGPVKCLMVEGDNGEFYPWYPDADRQLDSLSVTQNGIYRASDRGVYGWDRVSVNVAQSDRVTGKDPETGQEVTVTADPDTGELVETVVPVEIRVITPPTNPYGTYVDGQTITKDGMVVKAYDANGDEMQTVPIGEITINPTVAVYDESTDEGGRMEGEGVVAKILHPLYDTAHNISYYYGQWDSETQIRASGNASGITLYLTEYQGDVYGMVKGANSQYIGFQSPTLIGGSAQYNNMYFNGGFIDTTIAGILPHSSLSPAGKTVDDMEMIPGGSPQTITVLWPRTGDGAILETTFDIRVGPRSGQGDD